MGSDATPTVTVGAATGGRSCANAGDAIRASPPRPTAITKLRNTGTAGALLVSIVCCRNWRRPSFFPSCCLSRRADLTLRQRGQRHKNDNGGNNSGKFQVVSHLLFQITRAEPRFSSAGVPEEQPSAERAAGESGPSTEYHCGKNWWALGELNPSCKIEKAYECKRDQ